MVDLIFRLWQGLNGPIMRRNTVRLLKYMIVGLIIFIVGPVILKQLLGNHETSVERFVNANDVQKDENPEVCFKFVCYK